ncbi:hypothetical protein J4219_01485 [Candidatus Woesearchaeota archaeon]|nr:hypothetical protein [Candidatus Woesearchaeota archaeon]
MNKYIAALFFVMLAVFAGTAAAQNVPSFIVDSEVDGTELIDFAGAGSINKLNIDRNQEFELRLEVTSLVNADNLLVRASIDGYEFSSDEDISAKYGPFKLGANNTKIIKLTMHLPDDVELDQYLLRIDLSDRNNAKDTYEYLLAVDAPRHAMKIMDVTFNPGSTVTAGQSLLGRVRLENKGQKDEQDVKVVVSIPELGLSATQYIEEVENGDEQEETEEFFMRLPRCAEPGVYDVKVAATYNDGHDTVGTTSKITVLENEDCNEAPVVIVQPVQNATPVEPAVPAGNSLRTALEVVLLVLVALLVVVGLIIGFSRMREE